MYSKICDELLKLTSTDARLSDARRKNIESKITELKSELSHLDLTSTDVELTFIQEFESKYPNVTFCIDCVSRTMSRLGM